MAGRSPPTCGGRLHVASRRVWGCTEKYAGLLETREVFEKTSQRNEFESARRRLRYTLSPDEVLAPNLENSGATV